jgi:hypothetical protein
MALSAERLLEVKIRCLPEMQTVLREYVGGSGSRVNAKALYWLPAHKARVYARLNLEVDALTETEWAELVDVAAALI